MNQYKIIGSDGQEYGPVTFETMREWIQQRRANSDTQVQGPGEAGWRPLSSYPELAALLSMAGAPASIPQPLSPLPSPSPADIQQKVSGPGMALIVVGVISGLITIASLLMNLLGQALPFNQVPSDPQFAQIEKYVKAMSGTLGVISGIFALAVAGLTIYAGVKMRRLESYGLVLAMTIVNMLPCFSGCCCIGLPIGIWALTVLVKPEVKAAFR